MLIARFVWIEWREVKTLGEKRGFAKQNLIYIHMGTCKIEYKFFYNDLK
jgi:hypothetical protein